MSLFFKLHISVELQDSPQAFSDIAAEFPSEYVDNRFLKTKQALMYYYNRGIFYHIWEATAVIFYNIFNKNYNYRL